MIIPDLNLLLYATVRQFPLHRGARAWWDELLSGTTPVGIVTPVALGFVRLVTGPRLLATPLALEDATAVVRGWLDQPYVEHLTESPRTLATTLDLLGQAGAAGNLTTDAQIAAIARERKASVATNDTDFLRFEGVDVTFPLR